MLASRKPAHLATAADKAKGVSIADLFIDLGMSAEDVKQHIRVGDMVTLKPSFYANDQTASSKAMDDRAGCWVLINALKQLESDHNVYAVFSVQEEVGLRGAITSAHGIEADIGIALDVTLAQDIPNVKEEDYVTELGKGVGIKILDKSAISNRGLVDEFICLIWKKMKNLRRNSHSVCYKKLTI